MANLLTPGEIQNHFGTPLNHVPLPNTPFQLKGWHVLLGITAVGLICYGAYHLKKDAEKFFAENF